MKTHASIRRAEPRDAEALCEAMYSPQGDGRHAAAAASRASRCGASASRSLPAETTCSSPRSTARDRQRGTARDVEVAAAPARGAIGMSVSDDCQGKGVGTALMTSLLDIADNWLNYRRLELTVYTDNAAAIGLYRKFGFELEGTLREYSYRNGEYVDAYTMARLRSAAGAKHEEAQATGRKLTKTQRKRP
jgi:ribosomal protein S18 acetylase RimI-like enzyme